MNSNLTHIAVLFIAAFAFALTLTLTNSEEATAAPKYSYEALGGDFDVFENDSNTTALGLVLIERGKASVMVFYFKHEGIATYTARTKERKSGLSVNLGKFGRISLRVKPRSKWRKGYKYSGCTGKRGMAREVEFRGRIQFRGEGGYYKLRQRGRDVMYGEQFRNRTMTCDEGSDYPAPDPEQGVIALRATEGPRSVIAVREPYQYSEVVTVLSMSQRIGKIDVVKTALVESKPAVFTFSDDLTTATLQSPAVSVRGSAAFTRTGPDSGTWLGGLSARLPGVGRVKFAGPGFEANLGTYADIIGSEGISLFPLDNGRSPAFSASPTAARLALLGDVK